MNYFTDKLEKLVRLAALVFIFLIFSGQITSDNSESFPAVPESLSRHLDSLRKQDNLEEWLVSWIEFLGDKPAERISFLYKAESTAWRKPKSNDERLAWFDLLTNQGYYEMLRGNIIRSIDAYEKAYRYFFENPLGGAEADVLEYVLKPLGNNYTRLGDYDRAFFIQEKSLSLALQLGDKNQVASVYHNLATSARWKGQLPLAEQYCLKGLDNAAENSAIKGLLLSTYSEILLVQQRITEAETNVKEAIGILQLNLTKDKINTPNWLRGAYQGYGEILKRKNNPAAALAFYEKAAAVIEKYFKGERKREQAKLYVLKGQALLQLQQPGKANEQFNFALQVFIPTFQPKTTATLPVAADLYAENTILDALYGKSLCLLAMNEKGTALDCFQLLFDAGRRLRFEFFSSNAKQQQQKESREWVETAMQTAYDLWKTSGKNEYAEKMLLIAEQSKAQLLLDEMISNFHYNRNRHDDTLLRRQFQLMQAITLAEKESMLTPGNADSIAIQAKKEMQYELSLLQKKVKEKFPLPGNQPKENYLFTVKELVKKLPGETDVMEFFTGEKNIYIIMAGKEGVKEIRQLEKPPVIKQAIKEFVQTWFQQGPQKMLNEPQQYCRQAYSLYRSIWPGTQANKPEQLLIIPDGIFGYLPFDALLTDSTNSSNAGEWPFLIRRKNISFSYSLQTLLQQRQAGNDNRQFAGFFISFDSSANASIPAVKKEYASLQRVVKGNFFTEENVTLDVFQKQLAKTNLLHISTHSFLQGEERIPVLELADDKFFLFELFGKSFQPQLVVLSACRTGHGLLAEGEGIVSLARGFTASGAGGILAGLWNMHDESSADLVSDFYRQLKKDGYPATALHDAKINWLKKNHPQRFAKLPYYWAGLIFTGNNQPIRFEAKGNNEAMWWIVVIGILILGMLILFSRKKYQRMK